VTRSYARGTGIVVVLVVVLSFSARYSVSDSKVQTQHPAKHCTGRFDFALPGQLQPGGREQSIYLIKVWTRVRAAAFDVPPGSLVREFDLSGVGPAVWLRPSAMYPKDRKLLAMKSEQGQALFLEADATEGREQTAERVVARVAAGFAPASAQGFCVEHGAFVLAPSKNERALATFAGGGVEIVVQTETVDAPDDGQSTAGEHRGIRVLAKEPQTVAGLRGIGEKVQITEGEAKPLLVYSWIYPGEAASGLRPRIHMKASAPQDQRALLDSAWASLLGSLQQRAPGVR
jgi:hypothetical protein